MARTPSTMLELGTKAPYFSLKDASGETVVFNDKTDARGILVMFICNHCPFVIHVAERLAELTNDFMQRGFKVYAINSNDIEKYPDDSPEKMRQEVESRNYQFPYLLDETQEVAKSYRAACTPDFYLFDRNHTLVYRGRMDGSTPGNDVEVTGHELLEAVNALEHGKHVNAEQQPSIGCNIKWKPGNEPDYFG